MGRWGDSGHGRAQCVRAVLLARRDLPGMAVLVLAFSGISSLGRLGCFGLLPLRGSGLW